MKIEQPTDLGEVHLNEDGTCTLPITADISGQYEFIANVNGAYHYCVFDCEAGKPMCLTAELIKDYRYSFKIYAPDTFLVGKYTMLTT